MATGIMKDDFLSIKSGFMLLTVNAQYSIILSFYSELKLYLYKCKITLYFFVIFCKRIYSFLFFFIY